MAKFLFLGFHDVPSPGGFMQGWEGSERLGVNIVTFLVLQTSLVLGENRYLKAMEASKVSRRLIKK